MEKMPSSTQQTPSPMEHTQVLVPWPMRPMYLVTEADEAMGWRQVHCGELRRHSVKHSVASGDVPMSDRGTE